MKESNKKHECYDPPPLHQNNHILMSKTITEFEDKVRILLGIVKEPQLSDKNFDVWRSIDLNKTINKLGLSCAKLSTTNACYPLAN